MVFNAIRQGTYQKRQFQRHSWNRLITELGV